MVSPRNYSLHARLAFAAALLVCAVVFSPEVRAQELQARIYQPGNPTPQEGKITGVQNGAIQLTLPNGATQVTLVPGLRVDAAAPPAYTTGIAAFNAGNFDKALADLRPTDEKFRGLPTDWAQQTLLALGNIYLERNDVPKAEAAFNDFNRYYPTAPGSKLQVSVAQARIAFAKSNTPQAKQALDAIVLTALKAPAEVTRADGAAYGQAFYLMAKLQERDNNFQGALENYLRVVTLFYQDAAVTARAQKGADDLRAAHKGVAAP